MYLRSIVLLLLFCASAAISLVVFFITSAGEDDNFESQFVAAADKVTEAFMLIAQAKMESAAGLIVAITAHGIDHGQSWPFVTLSAFQERGATVKDSSGVLYVGINPIVTNDERLAWENYTQNNPEAIHWYPEARAYQKELGLDDLDTQPQVKTDDPELIVNTGVADHIYDIENVLNGKAFISPEDDWYLPVWQNSPVTQRTVVNQNKKSNSQGAVDSIKYDEVVFEGMQYSNPGHASDENPVTAEIAWLLRLANNKRTYYNGDIFSNVYLPIHDTFESDRKVVASMRLLIHWARYFENLLPTATRGVVFVLGNECDESYTYQINGEVVIPLGHGDLHDSEYDKFEKSATFADIDKIADGTTMGLKLRFGKCRYNIHVYPSKDMEESFKSNTPLVITMSVAFVFAFAVLMFFAYDRLVEKRQRILMDKARRTHQIVASLFPKNVRDQILNDDGEIHNGGLLGAKNNLKSFVKGGMDDHVLYGQMPIADLYPESTVMFADISGFTCWASSREPAQVFVLLQAVYGAFDEIAKKRRVFKVETIGDSYVACAGVPEADPAHAVKMCRFAWDCMITMHEVTRDLETQLGPGTGELTMRFGLNSGPVTAGLLRGDRARFQLFGDTVNTAARMESTGVKGKIQCSPSTTEELTRAGKEHWIEKRQDLVAAKGKGILQTYWLTPYVDRAYSANNMGEGADGEEDFFTANYAGKLATELLKREREVEWVAEVFRDNLRDIVAHRESRKTKATKIFKNNATLRPRNRIPLDEVVDVIKMPEFNAKSAEATFYNVKIPENVSRLVREYVSIISAAYPNNPFHNFEHACHVLLCTSKFLKRIVAPELSDEDRAKMKDTKKIASHLHTYTHGITSDPITMFAINFSALVHDTDHPGVSNAQLLKEQPAFSERYHNKSVAEQNSLDVAWDVLMDPHFKELREYIFETEEEMIRFRQVVVNIVLATDIFDPELNDLRKKRWETAFAESSRSAVEINNARATIVLEAIMQASDVCHTMQHWHIYTRFNKRLFEEISKAFREGRCGVDPATFWYEGEIKFFDNYVIPLAQRLKDCNVFGVSSDECLSFALRNRAEWENCGKAMVAEYIQDLMSSQKQQHASPIQGGNNKQESSKSV